MQEVRRAHYNLRQIIALAVLLSCMIAVVYLFSINVPAVPRAQNASPSLAGKIRVGDAPIPPYSASTRMKLEQSKGFQHLVSYTENGFEPSRITVKNGETVRFANNSSYDVWIAADGRNVQIYPRTREVCGSSDLDSCEPFPPQDFWEFTFTIPGEWRVVNNLDKSKGGVVTVQ